MEERSIPDVFETHPELILDFLEDKIRGCRNQEVSMTRSDRVIAQELIKAKLRSTTGYCELEDLVEARFPSRYAKNRKILYEKKEKAVFRAIDRLRRKIRQVHSCEKAIEYSHVRRGYRLTPHAFDQLSKPTVLKQFFLSNNPSFA